MELNHKHGVKWTSYGFFVHLKSQMEHAKLKQDFFLKMIKKIFSDTDFIHW